MSIDRRLERLEALLDAQAPDTPDWPEVEAAKQRALARLWLKLGQALDTPDHPRVVWARTFLQGDTAEQAALDVETLQRWRDAHPELQEPDAEGSRARLARKLEEIAQRLEANRAP